MDYSAQLILCFVLDCIFGDPRWYPHPVRGIGWICNKSEEYFRKVILSEYTAGLFTVITVVSSTIAVVVLLLLLTGAVSVYLEQLCAIIFIYMALSTKDLLVHSNQVYMALLSADPIKKGRVEVAKIVGRDTSELTKEGVCKACIETVAENMVDGATSPLFFAVLASLFAPFTSLTPIGCSAVGIFAYKAVNTMDSMIGYKNEQYLHFGRIAAKLDDVLNYLPARMSGICLIASAYLLRLNWKNAAKMYLRDRDKHSSPNAAHSEAAAAGALDIQLGGPSQYFGKTVVKPYIGDIGVDVVPQYIKSVNRLVVVGILFFTGIVLLLRQLVYVVSA